MTREELRDYVDEQRTLDIIPYHVYSTLIDGIDTLEQEPCDDAISREMALKECHDIVVDGERYRVIQEETLLGLPSVTQKSGHWMEKKHNGNMIMYHRYKCSVCDEKAKGKTGIWVQLFDYKYNYCPNCGAKMESEESEEV